MVHHCLQQRPLRPGDGPFGLVLAPTRELAQQVGLGGSCFVLRGVRGGRGVCLLQCWLQLFARMLVPKGFCLHPQSPFLCQPGIQQIEKEVRAFSLTCGRSVRSCIVVGGVAMQEQRHELRSGVEIVVATPGRFIDHLQQGGWAWLGPCRTSHSTGPGSAKERTQPAGQEGG